MSKFYKNLTREQVIERLTAQDVRTIVQQIDEGDFEFLANIIQGVGFTQYNNLTPTALLEEYVDREDRIEALIEDEDLPYDVA